MNFHSTIGFSTMTNVSLPKALSVKQFMTQISITEMEHPPNSLDLALYDFCLFPKIKSASKGRRFQDTENVKKM